MRDRRPLALLLLAALSCGLGWLERRPPQWLREDPLLAPFGLGAESDPVAALDSILFPPPPPRPEPQIIDPNRATRAEWIALPGIGPSTADRIAAWLQTGRRFRRAEDLDEVRGIGPARVEQLRPWLEFPVVAQDSTSVRDAVR